MRSRASPSLLLPHDWSRSYTKMLGHALVGWRRSLARLGSQSNRKEIETPGHRLAGPRGPGPRPGDCKTEIDRDSLAFWPWLRHPYAPPTGYTGGSHPAEGRTP
jgi:hypothetical protein